MAIRHIVLFHFYDIIDEETRSNAVDQIQELRTLPGILDWRIETSIDDRKGPVVVQNVLFESDEAFAGYRASDGHKAVGETLSGIADWLIADYHE